MIVDIAFLLTGLLVAFLLVRELRKRNNTRRQPQDKDKDTQEMREPERDWAVEPEEDSEDSQSEKEEGLEEDRKKLIKQEKKRQKKERQEAQQHHWKEANSKNDKYRQQQQEKEKLEEEKRLEEEKYLQQIAEEDRKKKEEEYNKWKDSFVVESSGTDKKTMQQINLERGEFEKKLFEYIKENKICLLEDMSIEFKIPTKAVVDTIKSLEEQKLINGVFDERGKYIDVTEGEWNAIMSYMKAKGRVSKSDMMLECASIIKQEGVSKTNKALVDLIDSLQDTEDEVAA